MITKSQLPEYPKTEVRDSAIVIIYENGSEETWGYEPNKKIAAEVAQDIELGLKAINYVSLEVLRCLSNISDELVEFGVPREYTNDYILEGYSKIARLFNQLQYAQTQAE